MREGYAGGGEGISDLGVCFICVFFSFLLGFFAFSGNGVKEEKEIRWGLGRV